MNRVLTAMLLACVLLLTAAAPALAYSYGDPNEEEVATMFKEITAKLQAGDWGGALPLYQAKRAEIDSHFGADVAVTLDRNFEAKDKAATEQNLKALMVMNLERRFTYGAKDINDYSQAKLLLAKARATYDSLEPYIQAKLPNEPAKLRAAFDSALEALGNPGLFGVGKKPVNEEQYSTQTAYILNTLTPLFPYKAAQATATPAPPAAPVQQPAASQPAAAAATANPAAPAASAGAAKPPAASAAAEASASPQASAAADTTAAPSATPAPAASEAAASLQPSATPAPAAAVSSPAAQEAAAHAPMAREDKTNTGVTFVVIGGVAAAAGGMLWWARRKGIL